MYYNTEPVMYTKNDIQITALAATTWEKSISDFTAYLQKGNDEFLKKQIEEENMKKKNEEWIWISGYKATDKDMKCRGYQYEINQKFDIDEGEDIIECQSGFHLCKDLTDVFDYYSIGDGNRFFEVQALVRKRDYANYGEPTKDIYYHLFGSRKNKLVAKSIIFTKELTPDEILVNEDTSDWVEDEKCLALEKGVEAVIRARRAVELHALGYSEAFSKYISERNLDKSYNAAKAVAMEPELSMDMKVLAILRA